MTTDPTAPPTKYSRKPRLPGLPPAPEPAAVPAPSAAAVTRETRAAGLEVSASTARGGDPAKPFGALPVLADGFTRITERVFDLPDPDAEYKTLEASLKLGTSEFDSLQQALDCAEDNARRAHRLYVNARVEGESYEFDAEVVEAAMRTHASAELQREKESGLRTKQITDADVTAKIAAMFPDEARDLRMRRIRARKMIEHLKEFADLWGSRCRSLAKMLESKR